MALRDDERFERLLGEYIDRFNDGESIDREAILSEYPDLGPDLLREIEVFAEFKLPEAAVAGASRVPLGTLGDYTLRRQIGRGGMGVVYEAWQNSMDRCVALKVMPKAVSVDTKAVARFIQEAQLAGKLSHPNIVHVHGMGVEEQVPYFAMEFVEGETLAQVLTKLKDSEPEAQTPLGKKDQVGYFAALANSFADVADGLQHAHVKGIIHRDIKPSNLILDKDGRLRILDFGLARLEGQESLTISGDVVGTPLYMSPEQARRKKIAIDHRTDVYSLGATLYEMLTLQPPFRGKDHEDTLSQIIERDPTEPRKVNQRVPKVLETIVLKCLRKDAGDRYGTAEAVGQDLRRFVRGEVIEARPETRGARVSRFARRHRRRILSWGVIALLLLVSCGLLVLHLERRKADRREVYERELLDLAANLQTARLTVDDASRRAILDPQAILQIFPTLEARFVSGGESSVRRLLARLEAVKELAPERPDAYLQMGRAWALIGDNTAALRELTAALEREPAFEAARALIATLADANAPIVEGTPPAPAEHADTSALAALWARSLQAAQVGDWRYVAQALSAIVEDHNADARLFVGASVESYLTRGVARLRTGDRHGALEDFSYARTRWPELFAPHLLLAKTYYLLEDCGAARRVLDGMVRQSSDPESAALWACVLCREAEDNSSGLAFARGAGAPELELFFYIRSERFHAGLERADELIEGGRIESDEICAMVLALEVAASEGATTRGLELLGRVERGLRAGLERGASSPMLHAHLGRARLLRGDLAGARQLFAEELRAHPENIHSRMNVAHQYRMCGRYDEQSELLRPLLESGNGVQVAERVRGWLLYREGRLNESIAAFESALATEVPTAFLLCLAADVYLSADDRATAADLALRGLSIDAEAQCVHEVLGKLLGDGESWVASRALEQALADLERTAQGDGSAPPWVLHTLALWRSRSPLQRELDLALRHARAALTRDPEGEVVTPWLTLARILAERGERVEAVRVLEEAVRSRRATLEVRSLLERFRLAALPAIASCRSADALLDTLSEERLTALMGSLSDSSAGEVAGRYMKAAWRLENGESDAAIVELRSLHDEFPAELEIVLRLVRWLNARGAAGEASQLLRDVLVHPSNRSGESVQLGRIEELWLQTELASARRSPEVLLAEHGELLRRRPALRGFLETLARGETVRIDCGDERLPSSCAEAWLADAFFCGGHALRPSFWTFETPCPEVYTTQRAFTPGDDVPAYRIPLPPGCWRLRLHFAEIAFGTQRAQGFDVSLQQTLWLAGYGPVGEDGPTMAIEEHVVDVSDGILEVRLDARRQEARIAGIELEPMKG